MFYLGNEIVVQMLRRAPVYWPRREHLICIEFFICQPHYICWCSLVKQLSIWPKLPWVLCFTLAYVSVNQYNTVCPIMKKAIPSYTMISLNFQFSRRIIYTPSFTPLTTHKVEEDIKLPSPNTKGIRIMRSNLGGGAFEGFFMLRNWKHLFFFFLFFSTC